MMNAKYLELLLEGKLEVAELLRMSEIPSKLYKYISLNGTEDDEKKYYSLSTETIWFSGVEAFNDPYEHKGMILDCKGLMEAKVPKEVIEMYNELFNTDDLEVVSFSSSGYDNLPMWAYYANNSKGFCVEYDVIKQNAIHEVIYEPQRIKMKRLIMEIINHVRMAMNGDMQAKKVVASYSRILMQSMYIKDISWSHEKECRIVIPIREHAGENIPLNEIGIRLNRVIAGINCKENDRIRLNSILKGLGHGELYCAELSTESFGIELKKYEGIIE